MTGKTHTQYFPKAEGEDMISRREAQIQALQDSIANMEADIMDKRLEIDDLEMEIVGIRHQYNI